MWCCYTTFAHFYSHLDYIEKNCFDKKFNVITLQNFLRLVFINVLFEFQ